MVDTAYSSQNPVKDISRLFGDLRLHLCGKDTALTNQDTSWFSPGVPMGTAITEEPIDMKKEIWGKDEIRDVVVNMFGKRPREEDDEGDNINYEEDQDR